MFTDPTAGVETLSSVATIRGIIDAVPHPTFVKNADSRFVIANGPLCDLMGRSADDVIGKSDQDFFPRDQAEVFQKNDRRVLDEGGVHESEELFTDGDGIVRTIITRKKRLVLSSGPPLLIGSITDISGYRFAEAVIQHDADHDFLTGIANRSLFERHLDLAVTQQSNGGYSAALLLIDLDGFKKVNDEFGHAAGDTILIKTACSLSDLAGVPDDVARLGGDEFAIIQNAGPQPDSAVELARAVIERLSTKTFFGSQEILVSASIGIAFAYDAPADRGALLRQADLAMYCAKKEGRNRWRFFDRTMARSVGQSRAELRPGTSNSRSSEQ